MKMECAYCGKYHDNIIVFCNECVKKGMPDKLTVDQNIQILKNLKRKVKNGLPLKHDDCDIIGMKNTYCTWGMCNEDPEIWNKPEYHTWPHSFKKEGRVAPLTLAIQCHFDRRTRKEAENLGCFFRCRVFQGKDLKLNREEAIDLINRAIKEKPKNYGL